MQDALLEAQAEVQAIMREVMLEITEAIIVPQAAMMWAQASADTREQFKQERPDQYDALMKGIYAHREHGGNNGKTKYLEGRKL